jgi:hypothetical protein
MAALDDRALNRATLARQLLLERHDMAAGSAIEHLVGMQAQAANAPYVGLWSRLDGFRAAELATMVEGRTAVRAPLMRGTIHLVTARDCLRLRAVLQPVLERAFRTGSPFGRNLQGVDVDAVLAAGRTLLDQAPLTRAQLGPALADRFPGHDATSLAHAVTYVVPVVQVPPRGVWGSSGPAAWATVAAWLGSPVDTGAAAPPDETVLRYLRAYGPATVQDVQSWSGLTRLGEVVDRLRPRLRTFRSAAGRELFDLPDAPRPDADTPAPVRFLPEYDNVLLSHADRTRFMTTDQRTPLFPGNGGALGTVLVDGRFAALWRLGPRTATITVEPAASSARTSADRAAVAAEGIRLLGFLAPDAADPVVVIA